jgi:glyoxylase-like metal-dependent hydrolase (beta-lactamase superfamily II)
VEAIAGVLDGVGQRLRQVVVTHDHRDHSSGTIALLARWPEARCLKWRGDPLEVPWIAIQDGETIDAGDERLLVVHTPGHAPDHICLWHEPSRTLFGGDLLVEGGTDRGAGGRGGNLRQYLARSIASLRSSRSSCCRRTAKSFLAPAALIEQYGAHRAGRERQVVAAIAAWCGFRGGNRRPGVP